MQRIASRIKSLLKLTMQINRVGKTRDLFKKTGDTNGKFHARIGTIKDKNGKEITEAEEIKKKWQEYTEHLYEEAQITMMVWSLT